MWPIWGRQGPGWPHVGPMNLGGVVRFHGWWMTQQMSFCFQWPQETNHKMMPITVLWCVIRHCHKYSEKQNGCRCNIWHIWKRKWMDLWNKWINGIALSQKIAFLVFSFTLLTAENVSKQGQHCYRLWLVACLVPSHYLNQWCYILNWILGNTFQMNLRQNTTRLCKKINFKMSSGNGGHFVSAQYVKTGQLYSVSLSLMTPMYVGYLSA